ncbi:GNAT family N-acetyltransferase [Sphingobacterium chuzhouense]|uniref:GNAT family N-acetyltransferase n=1 Tax=Sphingobacterium chuzhouense TaxID=1742264 RepID=A0ABR7XTA7_9SPHI|nr:GNAT family N-acetyltransferase [Sphingobacterium chuzhouense]MBD1422122.1 GNAT family N-acetyltransferase [Sphingobacterium chuzhouense]
MLQLLKYKWEDLHDYRSLVADDHVMKYITGKGMSEEQAREKFMSIMQINEEDDLLGYFKVIDYHAGLIGDCKLVRYKYDRSILEMGYLLKHAFWRKGFGTKICEKLLERATEIAPNDNIIGVIDPDNIASRRLLEKFGFKSYFVGEEDGIPTEKLVLCK